MVNRPVNLDLMTISFPPMAIVSILHRITGVLVFALIPVLFYMLTRSLSSPASFIQVQALMVTAPFKLLSWIFASSFAFHLIAGLRHLLMDFGIGEGLLAGRRSALLTLILSVIVSLFLGYWIW
jgi:succinate dehydrogenase / fumarate reductase cytochrome b subunit